jgi:hypothetical protein
MHIRPITDVLRASDTPAAAAAATTASVRTPVAEIQIRDEYNDDGIFTDKRRSAACDASVDIMTVCSSQNDDRSSCVTMTTCDDGPPATSI